MAHGRPAASRYCQKSVDTTEGQITHHKVVATLHCSCRSLSLRHERRHSTYSLNAEGNGNIEAEGTVPVVRRQRLHQGRGGMQGIQDMGRRWRCACLRSRGVVGEDSARCMRCDQLRKKGCGAEEAQGICTGGHLLAQQTIRWGAQKSLSGEIDRASRW